MENLLIKIKEMQDEINCICDEHEIDEELILKCSELIKTRQKLEYQAKNEVWEKTNNGFYISEEDFILSYMPDGVKLMMYYQDNSEVSRKQEFEKTFGVDADYIYEYGYDCELVKDKEEHEQMCERYYQYNAEFLKYCFRMCYPDKKLISFLFPSMAKGYFYEVYIVFPEKIEESEFVKIKNLIKDYCNGFYSQYIRQNDEILDYSEVVTILEHELPSNDLSNEEEIRSRLKAFSGTDRNIVIK